MLTIAHHSALRIDTITHTHRADADRPAYNLTAALNTLQICLGVQLMRSVGLYKVHEGVDYGIIWPILKAAEWAPTTSIRQWISDLLSTWPFEGVMVSRCNDFSNSSRIPSMQNSVWKYIGAVRTKVTPLNIAVSDAKLYGEPLELGSQLKSS